MEEKSMRGIYYMVKRSKMFLFFELNKFDEKAKFVFLPDWVLSQEYKQVPVNIDKEPIADLDRIFDLMNGGSSSNPLANEAGQRWIRENGVGHTSMSVGDIICTGKNWYVCLGEGWKEVNWLNDRK